jgi:hypothetical protein
MVNNIWTEVRLCNILICNDETFKGLNALLIQKIGALKNTPIDCNNAEKYWEIVEYRFSILPEGMTFYFPKYTSPDLSNKDSIPILMTWAELKPYLLKE